MRRRKASLLVISEDRSESTRAATRRLIERMCDLIVMGSHARRVFELEPREVRAFRGDAWRQRSESYDFREFVRMLARKVTEEDGYVLFHFDAEVTWPRVVDAPPTPKAQDALERLVTSVEQRLTEMNRPRALAAKLVPIVPYFEVESWLYQNTKALRLAIASCRSEHRVASTAHVEAWEQDRRALDEVEAPKDQICVGDRANETLAEAGFPTEEVFALGASFSSTVERLLRAPGLAELLQHESAAES